MTIDYREVILPIMGDTDGRIEEHLGTGAFIKFGGRVLIATAHHVVRDWNGEISIFTPPRSYSSYPYPRWNIDIFRARIVENNPDADIALLEVDGYSPPEALALGREGEIKTYELVKCLEYSTTRHERGGFVFSPATRIGNVTRVFKRLDIDVNPLPKKARELAIEVSFPALSGASGAPIMPQSHSRLWGLLISNVDYELLPVKVLKYEDKDIGVKEEVKYLAPHGIAVHVKHIREMM